MPQEWMTTKDLTREFGVSAKTIRRWEKKGILPPAARHFGRKRWLSRSLERVKGQLVTTSPA
jgi:DNA-binding transcriptional MerR regulator